MKSVLAAMAVAMCGNFGHAGELVWYDGNTPVSLGVSTAADPVVKTAMYMFSDDMEAVTGRKAEIRKPGRAVIRLSQLDRTSASQRRELARAGVPVDSLAGLTDGFNITVDGGHILVTGTNGRGTAYGLLELSRAAGVSPWIWWGDVTPEHKGRLTINDGYSSTQGASVEYRGVFINDEDWSLRPWSCMTFEKTDFGVIGPRTYKEVFKLLMRLRSNALWPAMHEGTVAFFKDPLNKLMADSCGIAIGSSHCEPLLRNNVGEWDVNTRGRYNYMTNRKAVQDYWAERLKEVKGSSGGNMFTIGMRGIHDGSMEGVKTLQEKFDGLQQVIDDQQELLAEHIGDPAAQIQVFVPYKEVLELYEMGLKVPEHVTLMWCDDNYGYMTRLSDEREQMRPGGGGVYYHLSYWGRPHDHLWLTTTQPGLVYNEMRTAYDHNVRKLWIANVHDPKVAAYDLELVLDLAWNIDCIESGSVGNHLRSWLCSNFGEEAGDKLYPLMRRYYNLCAKRKPEFMGWSQVELSKQTFNRGLSPVANTEFSFTEFGSEADRYMEEYLAIASGVEEIGRDIPACLADAYYAAVRYPVTAAASHAVKMLEAQRARAYASGGTYADMDERNALLCKAVARSQSAYRNIREMTAHYNDSMAGGKWKRSMDMRPRDLPVFCAPSIPVMLSDDEVDGWFAADDSRPTHPLALDGVISRSASAFDSHTGDARVVDMLGHSNNAVALGKGSTLSYVFNTDGTEGYRSLTVATIPTQPNDGGDLRYSVSVDGSEPVVFSLKEPFRSERWKGNVLRGQALRTMDLPGLSGGKHTLTITALDHHIVVDQWMLDNKGSRKFYLIPTEE